MVALIQVEHLPISLHWHKSYHCCLLGGTILILLSSLIYMSNMITYKEHDVSLNKQCQYYYCHITYPETAQTSLAWSWTWDLSEQSLLFVISSSIASQYVFPSTWTGKATFWRIIRHKLLPSSLHLLRFFGSNLFVGQTACQRYDAIVCILSWSVTANIEYPDIR